MENHTDPTWENQLWHARELLRTKGANEVRRHASVSIDNRHHCNDCFCCACVEVLQTEE